MYNQYLIKIESTFHRVSSIGVDNTLAERSKIKVRLLNKVAILAVVLTFVNMLVTGLYYGTLLEVLKKVGAPTASLFVLYLHSRKKYVVARIIMCYLLPLWLFILSVSGIGNGTELTLITVCAIICFIQYEGQQNLKVMSLCYLVSLMFGCCFITYFYNPERIIKDEFYLSLIFVLIPAIIIIYFLFAFYHNDILALSSQKDKLVKQLQSKNAELERFAYITSHDLKEPVRNIQSFAGMVKKVLSNKEETQKDVKLVQVIEDSATRMVTMIDSILKFSKLDQQDLLMEPIDLNNLVEEYKDTHQPLLAERKARVRHGNLPTVRGNKLFLTLLFQNLIENGIKYNESTQPTIQIYADKEDASTNISIKDNGIGVEAEFRDHIFEPFKRLHNRSKYEGTGLGLSICKKIVESHSGEIWVEENAGGGSTFVFDLPLS